MRSGRCIVIGVIVICAFLSPLWGLDPSLPLQDYLLDEWNVDSGLPANNVACLAQTPDGYLWIGTYAGLARFDGVKMQRIDSGDKARTLDSTTRSLHADRHGYLWISTFSGLTRFKDNRFRYFGEADGLPRDPGFKIYEDVNGRILITARADSIYEFEWENEGFKKFTTSKNFRGTRVVTILQDSKGILWFSSFQEGLFKLINDRFEKIKFNFGGKFKYHLDIVESRDGTMWMGTDKGLLHMDRDKQVFYTSADCGLSRDRPVDILEDNDGNLWVSTKAGVNRMTVDKDGKRQVQVALKKDYVRCFFEDNENNIWMGTRGNGLKRFRNPVVKTYTMDNGLPSGYIHSLLQAGDGTIWVATNTSLNRYRDGQFRIVENAEKDGWYSLCEDMDGNIWAGSRYGLFKNPTKERLRFTIKDGLPSDAISTLYCDGSNRIWISTTWGIARYAGGTITSLTKAGGMPGDVCNGFYEDKNHDILATASEGMLRLPKGEFPAKGAPVDIPGLTPSFVFEDKDKPDVLWAGTYIDGLQRFADGKWFSFKDAAGLVTNQFYQAVEDDNGYFWFTTNRGILRINKQGLEQFAEGKANWINCTSFNLKDGMLSLECSLSPLNSILKTRSGEYWFATTKGISVLNPSQIKIDTKPPNVILESIKVNREKIISNKEVTQLREVKEIAFQFTAPSFSSPTNTRFRYRMVGIDQKWQTLPPGARREVRYYDLPFGNYRFQVIACNKDSVWNTKGASVAFTVTAPFYASLWFWILILGIVVGFAVAVFLWFQKNYSRNKAPAVAYEGTKLDAVKSKKVMKGLIKLMEMEKAYQDEDLSLGSLAKQLNVTVHFLSQLINEKMGENFFDMVNRYRVEEVKTRLCDPADADTSIMEISYDAGFSAKSSFNRYFKKITGTTPSVFRRNNLHSK